MNKYSELSVFYKDGGFKVNASKYIEPNISQEYIKTNHLVVIGNIYESPELLEKAA